MGATLRATHLLDQVRERTRQERYSLRTAQSNVRWEYPDRWGTDCGVDLVFRHKNGEH